LSVQPRVRLLGLLAPLGLAIAAPPAPAEPMQLADTRPRWVTVRFEVSPEDAPGRLDAHYGEPLPAWLEPDGALGCVRVTIPAHAVEIRLLPGQGARPGSLGDFTWRFDAESGHVLSASFSGVLVRRLGVGLLRFDTEVEIRTELGTLRAAGFRGPERLLGEDFLAYCDPSQEEGCRAVPAIPYDPRTGYVNAVGFVRGRALGIETRTFSSLGEARFEELEGAALQNAESDGAALDVPAVSAPVPAPTSEH
jgi:hypothetical protein